MADVARFDIAIETSSRGVDSTAAELNTLAEKIQMTESVATRFDDEDNCLHVTTPDGRLLRIDVVGEMTSWVRP